MTNIKIVRRFARGQYEEGTKECIERRNNNE